MTQRPAIERNGENTVTKTGTVCVQPVLSSVSGPHPGLPWPGERVPRSPAPCGRVPYAFLVRVTPAMVSSVAHTEAVSSSSWPIDRAAE